MLKEFMPFIDKERYLVIQLFEFLEAQDGTSFSLTEITNFLHISLYKTKTVINEAIALTNDSPENYLILQNDRLYTNNIDNQVLTRVINKEANESMALKVFIHVHLNMYQQSAEDFQKSNGISSATYFRIQKSLNQAIGDDTIAHIKRNEFFARYYIYKVLIYFSYFDYLPDSFKTDFDFSQITRTINYITIVWHLNPTYSQQKQLRYFGFVIFFRSTINSFKVRDSNDSCLAEISQENELKLVANYFTKEWRLFPAESYTIVRFFVTFFVMTFSLPIKHAPFLKDYQFIKQITRKQINHLEKTLNHQFNDLELENYEHYLFTANAKILCPFFKNEIFQDPDSHDYSQIPINSPVSTIVTDLTNLITNISGGSYTEIEKVHIENIYFLVVLPKMIIKGDRYAIHIYVDFSGNSLLNNYVTDIITDIGDLNVHIDKVLNHNTDIYLTNNFNPSLSMNQIIWETIPTSADWLQLQDLVLNIRKKKFFGI